MGSVGQLLGNKERLATQSGVASMSVIKTALTCSESGDPGMPLSLGANDCLGPRSRATRFAGHLLAKPKAPGASGAFVILLHSSRPYIDG